MEAIVGQTMNRKTPGLNSIKLKVVSSLICAEKCKGFVCCRKDHEVIRTIIELKVINAERKC